ncbi:MAG: insulinase family protein [Candidatus Bostrichicola ureolyticus]|nr:MAG: insulinase family protein [Candidatus Bostrichicola ureolyticus]
MSSLITNKIIKTYEFELYNGLKVILYQDNTNPLIVVSMLYKIGNNSTFPGLSHCLEHLMFQTKNIKTEEFFNYVTSNGGNINAFTSKDTTFYYEQLTSNNLELALWLEYERIKNAKIDSKNINKEKKIIQIERSMLYDNTPYIKISSEQLPTLLFKEHPYKYSIIGSEEDINNFDNYDFYHFYKTYYVPNNAILTITGDFNLKEIKNLIKYYFESIPKGNIPIFNFKEEPTIEKEIVHTYKDQFASIPAIILSYRTNAYFNLKNNFNSLKNIFLIKLISKLLFNGESSFLKKNLIHKKKIASFINYSLEILENYTILTIYAITNKNISLNQLIISIDEEIENFKNKLSNIDIEKQINFYEKNFYIKNSYILHIAQSLSRNKFLFGKSNIDIISIYKAFTIDEIKNMANIFLNKNKRIRLYIIPK